LNDNFSLGDSSFRTKGPSDVGSSDALELLSDTAVIILAVNFLGSTSDILTLIRLLLLPLIFASDPQVGRGRLNSGQVGNVASGVGLRA
jgi:hypothetical protein